MLVMINNELIDSIWKVKYKSVADKTIEDTFNRVVDALVVDTRYKQDFKEIMRDFLFIPGGRILAMLGTDAKNATLSNCYVMPQVQDSLQDIMEVLRISSLTVKSGGGIGLDFSLIRPQGSLVKTTGCMASGPVSFMHLWDSMCKQIAGYGLRRGAMLGSLRIDHPDIMKFIQAKKDNSDSNPVLSQFNISVAVTDEFMDCLKYRKPFQLKFEGEVWKEVNPEEIWNMLVESNYTSAEPGVIFIDTINKYNNLYYDEVIKTTNPCSEQPLPDYGSCNLGSINLTRFVKNPFSSDAEFAMESFLRTTRLGVRFLDAVLDVNYYPLEEQATYSRDTRKIGLGVTGLGSMLAMLTIPYGSQPGFEMVDYILKNFVNEAYSESARLAGEKGSFPKFEKEKYLKGHFVSKLDKSTLTLIATHGIRNSNITSIAPTGSVSQLLGNVSSGIEPIFELTYKRKNNETETIVSDYSYALYQQMFPTKTTVPKYFTTAHTISPEKHLAMLATCQKYIDSGVSKTINVKSDIEVSELREVYKLAYTLGCKGCTIYRDGTYQGILTSIKPKKSSYKRPYRLQSYSYKIKIPIVESAYYVHCSYYYDEELKRNRPAELFINTKSNEHEEFLKTLGRITSAVFRKDSDPFFLIEEFKDVHSKTGFLSSQRQKYVPSLIAEIGEVLRDFFIDIGVLEQKTKKRIKNILFCPKCKEDTEHLISKCPQCLECGYSKCD